MQRTRNKVWLQLQRSQKTQVGRGTPDPAGVKCFVTSKTLVSRSTQKKEDKLRGGWKERSSGLRAWLHRAQTHTSDASAARLDRLALIFSCHMEWEDLRGFQF